MDTKIAIREGPEPHASANARLDEIGWALLLILTGVVGLMPGRQLPDGLWLIGVGAIILGLAAVRHHRGLKVSGFGMMVGSLALVFGLAAALGVELSFFAVVLILLGVGLLLKAWPDRDEAGPETLNDPRSAH